MLFNSAIFTVFLPLVFIAYWIIPNKFRKLFLLLASYYFYYAYNPYSLFLLIGTSAFDFWCARQIRDSVNKKKLFLWLSIVSNIGVLVAFKYSAFFVNTGFDLLNFFDHHSYNHMTAFVIPAGLSFYTFQSLSYTIDVYHGKYPPNDTLYEFLLYVSFFPHMVAGPVVRYHDLMPQLKQLSFIKNIDWNDFAKLTAWGYFKKMVIADNLGKIVAPVFDNVTGFNAIELFAAGILFVIQVYCDFSGYSDIATGVAKLFNINLSLNWRRPLLSKSLHEFWTRNHISITNWFRDYLYIGLGGNRVTYMRWLLNIFLVFVISGFWHGANITFIIWGTMHGLMYIIEILLKRTIQFKWPSIAGHIYLLFFHSVSLIAFRANSLTDLSYIYRKLFSREIFSLQMPNLAGLQDITFFILMGCMVLLLLLKEINEEYAILNKYVRLYKPLQIISYMVFILLIFILGDFHANTFIYFQF